MNANAKAWVEALRSGEFSQTTGRLADEDGYCCLGVACELYRRHTGNGAWSGEDRRYFVIADQAYEEDPSDTALPEVVRDWLGLTEESGYYRDDYAESLAGRNDAGDSFTEIANIIESEPVNLFQ